MVLVAAVVLFSAAASAEDLSSLTDAELLALHRDVLAEMAHRGLPDLPETDGVLTDITKRVISFFAAWNRNDLDGMLELCDSGWRAIAGDPRTELLRILANRTPQDATVERADEIAGEGPEGLAYYMVTVTSTMDRNNGKAADKYRVRLLVRQEKDGLWYVDPSGLDNSEREEGEIPPEAAAEPAEYAEGTPAGTALYYPGTVLYYQPGGGNYYHMDQNCLSVNPEYLPLQGSFLYSELNDEPYQNLKPCEVCGAPVRQEAPMSFRDAVDAAGEYAAVGCDMEALVVVAEQDGLYYRSVAMLDDRAKELYAAMMEAEDPDAAYEAFDAYAWSLPVSYTEQITASPKDREELETQAGKTVGELLEEGYAFYGIGGGEHLPTCVFLSYGLFIYEFEVDAPFDYYSEHEDWEGLESLQVKNGARSASLSLATDLDYSADGTYRPRADQPADVGEAAAPAGDGFAAPKIIPAGGIEDFIGEWQYVRIENADGSAMDREEMLADGIVDDRPEITVTEDEIILYSVAEGEIGSVRYEFVPGDGTLEILNDSDDPPVLCLADNGMLVVFVSSNLSSGDMTAYLVRKEQ